MLVREPDALQVELGEWTFGEGFGIEGQRQIDAMMSGAGTRLVNDRQGRPVMLFESEWALDYVKRQYPDVQFLAVTP